MSSGIDVTATESGMALSILYVTETSLLLSKVRRTILASAVTSTVLMILSILIFGGFAETLERLVPFHEEFIGGVIVVLIIVPLSIYLTHRATNTMQKWRDHLDSLSYALRFELHKPEGETPNIRLANQALNALNARNLEHQFKPSEFTDKKKDAMTFDVIIPREVTKTLSGHDGTVIAARVHGNSIRVRELTEIVQKIRSFHLHLWRLLIVSNEHFPQETIDYYNSFSKRKLGFHVDLVEETQAGFSFVSSGN